MKTEWWYESAIYDLDGDVVFARLTLQDDGTARILTDGGETRKFASWDDATHWLGDEEHYPLDSLYEALHEKKIRVDPRIKPPLASCEADLNPSQNENRSFASYSGSRSNLGQSRSTIARGCRLILAMNS